MADPADDLKILVKELKKTDPVMAKQSDAVVEGILHRWADNTPGVGEAWERRNDPENYEFAKMFHENKANLCREARGERTIERPNKTPMEIFKMNDREYDEYKRQLRASQGE